MFISTITAWEVALLVDKGRLTLTMDVKDWIDTVTAIEGVRFVPVDNEVAMQSVRLPDEFHPSRVGGSIDFEHERIARTPAAARVLFQCAAFDQVLDVAQGGVV